MAACISLIVVGVFGVMLYIFEKIKGYTVKEVLIKTSVSLLFVLVSVLATFFNGYHQLNIFIIFGLVLGLIGDILLDLKYVYPQDDKPYTYGGFVVFGLGHIFYILGMILEFYHGEHILYILLPLLLAPFIGLLVVLLEKPLKLNYKEMKVVVFSYATLLFMTPATALSFCIMYGFTNTTLLMLFIGGVLFAISDLVLSNTYFGENHERPIDFILNYLPYYGAQFIIAFSLMFL